VTIYAVLDRNLTRQVQNDFIPQVDKEELIQAAQAHPTGSSAAYASRDLGKDVRRQDLSAQATDSLLRHQNLQVYLTMDHL
jgi:hypothetical protein